MSNSHWNNLTNVFEPWTRSTITLDEIIEPKLAPIYCFDLRAAFSAEALRNILSIDHLFHGYLSISDLWLTITIENGPLLRTLWCQVTI